MHQILPEPSTASPIIWYRHSCPSSTSLNDSSGGSEALHQPFASRTREGDLSSLSSSVSSCFNDLLSCSKLIMVQPTRSTHFIQCPAGHGNLNKEDISPVTANCSHPEIIAINVISALLPPPKPNHSF